MWNRLASLLVDCLCPSRFAAPPLRMRYGDETSRTASIYHRRLGNSTWSREKPAAVSHAALSVEPLAGENHFT